MQYIKLSEEELKELEKQIAVAFNCNRLIKGFYQTLKAISLYHTNPIVKLVISGQLEDNFYQVLTKAIKATNISVPIYTSSYKTLVSKVIRAEEQAKGKKPRAPFACRLFCLLANPISSKER